ncbi:MAG TPA: ABC transporter substrate-binding protein [Gaiellaceae bacterium]|nr:ABC transporter substrate-binding protein [Gaiellaceae bacterium]
MVDKSFDLKTADPQRQFEVTGGMIAHVLYDTLLEFRGSDVTRPRPSVAARYTVSKDARTYTFTLRRDVRFSDGTPLTAKDVVFSFRRLINLKGNPSFLLAGVTVSQRGKYTVILKSKTPNPAIPAIVANASLGIVNSKLVKANGGTDAVGADKKDKAEQFLNRTSAGSGPYLLKSFDTTSRVELVANPRYWGPRKPAFKQVVIRNVQAPAQLLNVQRGRNEIALDLSPSQASSLMGNAKLIVQAVAGPNVWFLFANANPQVSEITANKRFQNAIRYALDYEGLVRLAGAGARRAAGVVPSMFLGALEANKAIRQDLAKARAELRASGLTNPEVELEFPSDFTSSGLSFGVIAQKIQSDLAKVGIKVNLAGKPIAISLANYRAGKEQLGLWLWGPDYPDPNDYLVFLPGQLVGLRAGWAAGSDPALEALGRRAGSTSDRETRARLFRTLQVQLSQRGPFFTLFQPGQVVASSRNLTGVRYNPVFQIDLASIGSR